MREMIPPLNSNTTPEDSNSAENQHMNDGHYSWLIKGGDTNQSHTRKQTRFLLIKSWFATTTVHTVPDTHRPEETRRMLHDYY